MAAPQKKQGRLAAVTISFSKAFCANAVPLKTRQVMPAAFTPYRKPRMWLIAPPPEPIFAGVGIKYAASRLVPPMPAKGIARRGHSRR